MAERWKSPTLFRRSGGERGNVAKLRSANTERPEPKCSIWIRRDIGVKSPLTRESERSVLKARAIIYAMQDGSNSRALRRIMWNK